MGSKRATAAKPVASESKAASDVQIVNPAGAVHLVSVAQARDLLARVGYRKATAEEVAQLAAQGGRQTWDAPIAATWAQEVAALLEEKPE